MDFFDFFVGAVASEKAGDVVESVVGPDFGHGATDDVDVVADREFLEFLLEGWGEAGEFADGFEFIEVVVGGHQGGAEVFRENAEIGTVVADGIDEVFHLFEEGVNGLVGAHLPLNDANADLFFDCADEFFVGFVVDVFPF